MVGVIGRDIRLATYLVVGEGKNDWFELSLPLYTSKPFSPKEKFWNGVSETSRNHNFINYATYSYRELENQDKQQQDIKE